MEEEMMIMIQCNGVWEGTKYVDADSYIVTTKTNLTFDQLVDTIFETTGIDRSTFNIKMHYLVPGPYGLTKTPVRDNKTVRCISRDNQAYKHIFVDTVLRDTGSSRPIVRTGIFPQSVDPPVCPNDGQNYFASSAGSSMRHADHCSNETNIVNDNQDLNAGDRDDDSAEEEIANVDRDENPHLHTSEAGGDINSPQCPEIRFSGYQFEEDPLQPYWVVPGVEHCQIEPIRTETPIFYQRNAFYRGAIFNSKEELKMALGQYALKSKFDYRIRRSCSIRFEAGCKDVSCKFKIRAICRAGCVLWHVVKYVSEHTCSQDVYQSHFLNVKAMIIGKLFSKRLRQNDYRPSHVIGEMLEQYGVQILYTKAWRALEYAKNLAFGTADDSYQQLPSYFHMLTEVNPGTITAIETDENDRFLYSFLALGASIAGFRSYMRPVIAVDATHLKGEYKGVIFVAACKDGGEMIYPIAFGFGDGESTRSWTWFLNKLRAAIGCPEDLVIISDRNASIGNAMDIVFPQVPHLCCFFHMKQNIKKYCRNRKDVMDTFYSAAYTHLTTECDMYMVETQSTHPTVYNKLVEAEVRRWSRSYAPKRRYTIMTTNIAESLNKCMMKARRLPITSAHEFLRHMLQKWFCDRRAEAAKLTSDITDAAASHINVMYALSMDGCDTSPIVYNSKYLVRHHEKGNGIVDVEARTCSCRQWDLDQLPCYHAVAVARSMRVHCNTFCHKYYSTEWLKAAYEPPINPLPNKSGWDVPLNIRMMAVLPPIEKRQAGRPKECRIPSAGEGPRRKKCGKCGLSGHNRLRCPNLSTSSIGESSASAARASRRCSFCHETGHTVRRCPLRVAEELQVDQNMGNDTDGNTDHTYEDENVGNDENDE